MKSAFFMLVCAVAAAQPRYELLIRGGHVIDPANGVNRVADVAIAAGKIARIAVDIPPAEASKVLDARGRYVTPGLIDLHAHVFGYSGSIFPDDSALPAGTTTVVDAGGAGWRTFDRFRDTVIKRAQTRVLSLINIVGHGMLGARYEDDVADMDSERTAAVIRANRESIVGIKTAHFGGKGWVAIDRAIAAGKAADVPVLIDDKIFTYTGRTSREKLLDRMRPGDLHTHMYNDRQVEIVDRFSGKVQPYAFEARRRGVLFDMGHGGGSFLWPVAVKAMQQGFPPDTISTDLHSSSILIPQSDMANCMSKLMSLGMSLEDAVLRSTVNPAKAIKRFPELGTLGEGRAADVAVFDLQDGAFVYKDAWKHKLIGTKKLEAVAAVRAGRLVYERKRETGSWKTDEPAPANRQRPAADAGEVYDILLKGGRVLDPKNARNARLDIGITGERIRRVAAGLPAAQARRVVDVTDFYVTPGLIDAGGHFDPDGEWRNLNPDHNCLPHGVTTAVHLGAKLPKSKSETRLLAGVRLPQGAGVIATGLSKDNVLTDQPYLTNLIARQLATGLPLDRLIARATVNAAKALGRPDLGGLDENGPADVAVLDTRRGVRCVLTVRGGDIVWDTEGLSLTDWQAAGPYSNFK